MSLLGIDFGTSYCAAAYFDAAAHPTPVAFGTNLFNGKYYKTPTVIQYAITPNNDEIKIIGEIALSNLIQSNNSNSAIISKIKTELHERNGYIINGKPKLSVEVVSDILQYIKQVSEEQSNTIFEDVIITHPAQYELGRKKIIHDAAIRAGFENVFLVEEPIAAAYAFIDKYKIEKEKGAIVFDYGGGTIDVAYLWYDENYKIQFKFEPESRSQCGGEYIDILLHNHISKIIDGNVSKHISPVLLNLCTKTKINFTDSVCENIAFQNKALKIDRSSFENIIQPKVGIAIAALESIVKTCESNHLPIDYVMLNGGSSRLNIVLNSIKKLLPDAEVLDFKGDDLAVALGSILFYSDKIGKTQYENDVTQVSHTVRGINRRLEAIRESYKKQLKK